MKYDTNKVLQSTSAIMDSLITETPITEALFWCSRVYLSMYLASDITETVITEEKLGSARVPL